MQNTPLKTTHTSPPTVSLSRRIGGMLLVTGTTIGAGMLALPAATSPSGFTTSIILLSFCWVMMAASGLLLLEVTLWMPRNTNLISMAKKTLGPIGELVTWGLYLLLLYALLAAYIAGGADIFQHLALKIHLTLPLKFSAIIFTAALSLIVLRGIFAVDFFNRFFMSLKFITFFLLTGLIVPHIHPTLLLARGGPLIMDTLTVAITSFGFATIIPSLRNFLNNDAASIRWAILTGSLLPLFCYILWNAAVMGIIPRTGPHGLMAALHASQPTSTFIQTLLTIVQKPIISLLTNSFTAICMLTSFLGIALCLTDFLADGFRVEKKGKKALLICLAAILPPLLFVIWQPSIFISALRHAGIIILLLLVIIPNLMVWRGRYHLQLTSASRYRVAGGQFLLCILLMIAGFIIIQEMIGYLT